MEKKERYFIVSYSVPNGFGQCDITSGDGGYVNREFVGIYVNRQAPNVPKNRVVILNIVEVSKDELDYFKAPYSKE